MAKSKSGSGDRAAKVAKAGKRSGQTTYPAAISNERRVAKERGEQQFYSDKQLTVEREGTVIVPGKNGQFVYKTKKVIVSADHAWDANRGRVISSPKNKGDGK